MFPTHLCIFLLHREWRQRPVGRDAEVVLDDHD